MHERLGKLFSDFAEALLDGDFDKAATWCDVPVTIVRSRDHEVLWNQADAAADLRDLWAAYAAAGTCGLRHHILDLRGYVPGLLMADIEWRMLDRNGNEIARTLSTYTLRERDGRYRVAHIVSHNEQLRRPMGSGAIRQDAAT